MVSAGDKKQGALSMPFVKYNEGYDAQVSLKMPDAWHIVPVRCRAPSPRGIRTMIIFGYFFILISAPQE